MKKERLTTSDEQRERMLIAEQIERAQADAEGSGSDSKESPVPEEAHVLKRDDSTPKVVLSLAPKAPSPPTENGAPSGLKFNALKPAANPLKVTVNPLKPTVNPLKAGANPLKRTNVFKAASSASSVDSGQNKKRELSVTEKLMAEDQERKRRRMEREAVA